MTPPQQTTAAPAPQRLMGRPRRVKRGIVAGYIHEISPRHREPVAAEADASRVGEPVRPGVRPIS